MIARTNHSANMIGVTAFALCGLMYVNPNAAHSEPFRWADAQRAKGRMRPELPKAATNSPEPEARWEALVQDGFAAIRQFQAGWDGPHSDAISENAISIASRVLDVAFASVEGPMAPAVVPCADGSVQLEWRLEHVRFEIDIEPDGSIEAWGLDRNNGRQVTAEGTEARSLMVKWAARLTA